MTVPFDEFLRLVAIREADNQAVRTRILVINAHASEILGCYSQSLYSCPDRFITDELRKSCQSAAYAGNDPQVGEEDVNGDIHEGGIALYLADIGKCGPASLAGKIIAELCRRMDLELDGDERMVASWEPPA